MARFRSGNARSLRQRDDFSNILIMLAIFHVELASAVQGWMTVGMPYDAMTLALEISMLESAALIGYYIARTSR